MLSPRDSVSSQRNRRGCPKRCNSRRGERMDRTRIPGRDWELLSRLTPVALERLCARVLAEAARITAVQGMTSHERYLKLYDLMKKRDRDLAFAFDDHRCLTTLVKTA